MLSLRRGGRGGATGFRFGLLLGLAGVLQERFQFYADQLRVHAFDDTADALEQKFLILGVLADASEEHTSELQSRLNIVCRLLLEKKNKHQPDHRDHSRPTHGQTTCRPLSAS